MILYASLVAFAMLYTLVRTGVFGFYVAVVPIFSLLAAYQFFTGKHALLISQKYRRHLDA